MNHLIYVCNAIDDKTKIERNILTDSPASTKKILLNSKNLKCKTVAPIILSLGRGKSNYSFKYYKSKVSRINGVPIIYAPFFIFKIISKIVSFLWPLVLMLRFKKKIGNKVFLFWNRTPAYIPILIVSKILRFRNVLDLEDGAFYLKFSPLNNLKVYMMNKIYDSFCSHALVTCNGLKKNLKIKNVMCHYGFIDESIKNINFSNNNNINIHLGGTITKSTGSDLVIKSIKKLRKYNYKFTKKINFIITGKGNYIEKFKVLSNQSVIPEIKVYENLSHKDYTQILRNCNVGLALKPKSGDFANSTFPSKVIEIANNGLLLVTTDISDVKLIFGDSALYTNSNVNDFIDLLEWITINYSVAKKVAKKGSKKILDSFNCNILSEKLNIFLFK